MKKTIFLVFVGIFCIPFFVSATSGACSYHSGVNCYAGADWDGSVICNDGWRDSSVSYSSMVMCQGSTGYSNAYSTTPTCPSMSSYSYLSKSCECYSGYIVGTDYLGKQACVSANSKCTTDYGYGAQYDSLSNQCECRYGYIMYGGKCIDDDQYCSNTYSYFNASYNSLYKKCECDYGYIYDGASCVSESDYCRKNYSYSNSRYNSLLNKCECNYGYEYNGTSCISKSSYSNIGSYSGSYSCPANSTLGSDNTCYCNSGFQVDASKTGCVKIACPDLINGYLSSDGKCYCNNGYQWDSNKNQCIKIETSNVGVTLGVSYSEDNPLGLKSGWLIKNKKFAEVFSVDSNICLHWIMNEGAAERFYGPTWNDYGVIKEFDEIPAVKYKFCDNIK